MKAFALFPVILLAIFTITGCRNGSDLDATGVPSKLLVGMYGGDNPAQTKAAMAPIRDRY
jgi:phosphonate transport system substrate-binding protein